MNRRDVEPEPEPSRRHPVATWRRIEGATAPHSLPVDLPEFRDGIGLELIGSDQIAFNSIGFDVIESDWIGLDRS